MFWMGWVSLQEYGVGVRGHVLGPLAGEVEALGHLSCPKRTRLWNSTGPGDHVGWNGEMLGYGLVQGHRCQQFLYHQDPTPPQFRFCPSCSQSSTPTSSLPPFFPNRSIHMDYSLFCELTSAPDSSEHIGVRTCELKSMHLALLSAIQ